MVEEAPIVEELLEWLTVSDMHECTSGTDGLYNPLPLGTVSDTEDLVASAVELKPMVCLGPPLESGDDFGAVCSESAFASADFNSSEFLHVTKIEDPPISFADVERLHYQRIWNFFSNYTDFRGLWD